MTPFTIIVEFVVDAADMPTFLPHMLRNAQTSLLEEDGCERFDVLKAQGCDERIVLYEIYRDKAAFAVHGTSRHFLEFEAATKSLVRHKTVTVFEQLCTPIVVHAT
jgi:quinol monooxygenase YgiN